MPEIQLTRGKVANVDEVDFEWASQYSWHAYRDILKLRVMYVARRSQWIDGRSVKFYLHQEIARRMGFPAEALVDHRDTDTLNCRRENLRPCTKSQNQQNKLKGIHCTSRFKGVYWEAGRGKWKASIANQLRQRHLGRFTDEDEAARAYDEAARIEFGVFARLNFPQPGEQAAIMRR